MKCFLLIEKREEGKEAWLFFFFSFVAFEMKSFLLKGKREEERGAKLFWLFRQPCG